MNTRHHIVPPILIFILINQSPDYVTYLIKACYVVLKLFPKLGTPSGVIQAWLPDTKVPPSQNIALEVATYYYLVKV